MRCRIHANHFQHIETLEFVLHWRTGLEVINATLFHFSWQASSTFALIVADWYKSQHTRELWRELNVVCLNVSLAFYVGRETHAPIVFKMDTQASKRWIENTKWNLQRNASAGLWRIELLSDEFIAFYVSNRKIVNERGMTRQEDSWCIFLLEADSST